MNEHFLEPAAKSAASATLNGRLRRDRVAEASSDPSHNPGGGTTGASPGRQTVGQVMRPPPATIEPSAHLAAASYLIKHSHDSALVVTTDDTHEPVAIITDAEITRAAAEGQDLENTRISHVFRKKPPTVEADLDAADAARLMLSKEIRHLPVVEKRRLVGMVDLTDLCPAGPEARTTCGGAP